MKHLVLHSASRAEDAGYRALADIASITDELDVDYRLVGGQMTTLLVAAYGVTGVPGRETADADLAAEPAVVAHPDLPRLLAARDYRPAGASNRFARQVTDGQDAVIDVLAPSPDGRLHSNRRYGELYLDEIPGLLLALARRPVTLTLEGSSRGAGPSPCLSGSPTPSRRSRSRPLPTPPAGPPRMRCSPGRLRRRLRSPRPPPARRQDPRGHRRTAGRRLVTAATTPRAAASSTSPSRNAAGDTLLAVRRGTTGTPPPPLWCCAASPPSAARPSPRRASGSARPHPGRPRRGPRRPRRRDRLLAPRRPPATRALTTGSERLAPKPENRDRPHRAR